MRLKFLFAAILLAAAPALAAGKYDGRWLVEGTTDVGDCAKTFRAEIEVRDDDIVGVDAADAKIVGAIDATNAVWARLSRAPQVARASGKASGAAASGAWSSGSNFCGGRWKAHRIGQDGSSGVRGR